MPRQRHYRNFSDCNRCVFVTTTCLDFVPLFKTSARRDEMARRLLDDHRHYGAQINSFVIMPEHLHWLCLTPPSQDISWLVQRIKVNSAHWLLSDLTEEEGQLLSRQSGLGRRQIWQRSFRSFVVSETSFAQQKQDYIHQNPVRRGLVESALDYRWSSARFHEFGEWDSEFCLPFDVARVLDCPIL